MCVTEEKNRYS